MIKDPDFVWQEQLNELFKNESPSYMELFFSILNLIIGVSSKNKDIYYLYKLLDIDTFSKVINTFNGRNIKLMSSKELKDAILFTVLYYYKEIKGMDWDEIRELVPFDVKSIKYGIKIKNLNDIIKKELYNLFNTQGENNE